VSQADRKRVVEIIENEFPNGLDLVIDDASHAYAETKATFETVFPCLRTGGIYIIEDWNWAHDHPAASPDHFYASQPALTNLIFELVVLHGGTALIDEMGMASSMAWMRRSWRPIPRSGFRIDDHLPLRGKRLELI
jgi:hypothetical protein